MVLFYMFQRGSKMMYTDSSKVYYQELCSVKFLNHEKFLEPKIIILDPNL